MLNCLSSGGELTTGNCCGAAVLCHLVLLPLLAAATIAPPSDHMLHRFCLVVLSPTPLVVVLWCVLDRLVEAFGSTRRKRQLQARAEGTVVVQQNAAAAELDVLMQEVQARAAAAGDTREEVSESGKMGS